MQSVLFFDCVVISDLYLFQEIVLFYPCLYFVKYFLVHIIINKQSNNWNVKFSIIWNVALVDCIAATPWAGGLASGFEDILGVIDISDFTFFLLWQIKFYFTVNQCQIKWSPKITQIF